MQNVNKKTWLYKSHVSKKIKLVKDISINLF